MDFKKKLAESKDVIKHDYITFKKDQIIKRILDAHPEDLADAKISRQPVACNSMCALYLDESSLPNGCDLRDIYGAALTYAIYLPDPYYFPYIGYTDDIGERCIDHVKDGRDEERKFYKALRMHKVGIIKIIAFSDNTVKARLNETNLIQALKKMSFELETNEKTRGFLTKEEIAEAERKHLYNINN